MMLLAELLKILNCSFQKAMVNLDTEWDIGNLYNIVKGIKPNC